MAYATELTLTTGNKVSLNYQSHEVSVSVIYQLEREDSDVVAVVREKTAELAEAHHAAWQTLRDAKVAAAKARHEVTETNPQEAMPSQETLLSPASQPTRADEQDESVSPSHLPSEEAVKPKGPLEPATPGQRSALRALLGQAGWNAGRIAAHLQTEFDCEHLEDLNGVQAAQWLLELQRAARIAAQQQRQNASLNGK